LQSIFFPSSIPRPHQSLQNGREAGVIHPIIQCYFFIASLLFSNPIILLWLEVIVPFTLGNKNKSPEFFFRHYLWLSFWIN
jgi:hypothetical protein